jgi:hypothetical protein
MTKRDPIKIQIHFILGFLVIQYLFGIFINLFTEFPDTKNVKTLWEFAQGQMTVVLHMVIGVLLVLSSIIFLIRTIQKKDRQLIIASSIGLVAFLAAAFTGAQFVSTQTDAYSYTMAVAFIIAFVAYGWGLYKTKK